MWLKNNDDLIVRSVDKFGARVVWRKRQYIDGAPRQLNDPQYYVPLASNSTAVIKNELKDMMDTAFGNFKILSQIRNVTFFCPKSPG